MSSNVKFKFYQLPFTLIQNNVFFQNMTLSTGKRKQRYWEASFIHPNTVVLGQNQG